MICIGLSCILGSEAHYANALDADFGRFDIILGIEDIYCGIYKFSVF